MTRDNVTPFRPKKPQPRQPNGLGLKSHRGKAVLVQALTLAAFGLRLVFTTPPLMYVSLGIAIAAVAIAASNRNDSIPWANTHHEHALRTLVIGYAILTLGSLLGFFGPLAVATFFITIAVLIWAGIRALVGLVLAVLRKPIPKPKGILF